MKGNSSSSNKPLPQQPKGSLYIAATPIGNIDDCSFRLVETLRSVSLIAAEDTRVTQKLLSYFKISTKLISVQKFNEAKRLSLLENVLSKGLDVALVSDAGTPNISDPGALVVNRLTGKGIQVIAVPGPSAITALASISGILANQFYFGGFFPKKNQDAVRLLASAATLKIPIIFFESGKRLLKTLQWIKSNYTVKSACVGKELTKKYEAVYRGSVENILTQLKDPLKGEWSVMIEGVSEAKKEAADLVMQLTTFGLDKKQIMKVMTMCMGYSRNDIYDRTID